MDIFLFHCCIHFFFLVLILIFVFVIISNYLLVFSVSGYFSFVLSRIKNVPFVLFTGSTHNDGLNLERGSRRRKGSLRTLPFDVTSMENLPSTDSRPPVSPRPSSPLSGEDYMDRHDMIPGSCVRPRRARKAVRRSKSALDARPKLRLSENDPREPPVPRVDRTTTRPPWSGRSRNSGRGKARQMSLPENTYINESDRVIALHQVGPDPQTDGSISVITPFQTDVVSTAVPISRQHSSSLSPEGSINLSPLSGGDTVPISDSSDRDQKSNVPNIPRVQFRFKKSRVSSKSEKN